MSKQRNQRNFKMLFTITNLAENCIVKTLWAADSSSGFFLWFSVFKSITLELIMMRMMPMMLQQQRQLIRIKIMLLHCLWIVNRIIHLAKRWFAVTKNNHHHHHQKSSKCKEEQQQHHHKASLTVVALSSIVSYSL